MVMTNNAGDFCVIVNFREDLFTDCRVLLHLSTFLERQCAGLLEKSCRKTNLSDVMH